MDSLVEVGQEPRGVFDHLSEVNFLQLRLSTHDGLKSVDLLPLVESFIFTEDLFTPTMSGTCILRDTVDLHNFFPVIGEETISAMFSVPGMEDTLVSLKFRVYAVTSPVASQGDRIKTYVLSFISEEQITDSFKKIRRAFKEVPGEIVSSILKNDLGTLKEVFIDSPGVPLRAVIPRWAPFETINFLSRKAVDPDKDNPSVFLFYEDLQGFHFSTFQSIVDEGLKRFKENTEQLTLKYRINTFAEDKEINPFIRIMTLSNSGAKNTMAKIKLGVYSNKALSFDMIRKTVDETFDYDYTSDFNIIKAGLGKFKTATDSFLSEVKDDLGIEMLMPADIGFDQQGEENEVLAVVARYRAAFTNLMKEFELQVTTTGHNFIHLGDVVEAVIPKTTGIQTESFLEDELLSGQYLVTAIKHTIVSTIQYQTTYRLLRTDSIKDLNEIAKPFKEGDD